MSPKRSPGLCAIGRCPDVPRTRTVRHERAFRPSGSGVFAEMLRSGDAGAVHRVQHRPRSALLGIPDLVHRRTAARGRGHLEGPVPAGRDVRRRGRGGGDGAAAGRRARAARARLRELAGAVRVRLAARPHAALVHVRAGRLQRLHHRPAQRRRAGRHLHGRGAAGAGDQHRHPVRQPGACGGAAPIGDRPAAGTGRGDPARCRALVGRRDLGRAGADARRRAPPAGAGRDRVAPALDPPAVRPCAPGAARARGARAAGPAFDRAPARRRGAGPPRGVPGRRRGRLAGACRTHRRRPIVARRPGAGPARGAMPRPTRWSRAAAGSSRSRGRGWTGPGCCA